MAGKTLINGTAYDISGGKTLVNGTAYSIAGGKTLIDGTAYDISFIKAAIVDLWTYSIDDSESYVAINGVTYANGYWVVVGQYYDGSRYYARMSYTTDLNSDWTTTDLWSGIRSYNKINSIAYANGYWVVVGQYNSGNATYYYGRIAYTTDITGTWTTNDNLRGSSSGTEFVCVTYANGYWVAGGKHYNSTRYATIMYTTDPTGTWYTKYLWSSSASGTFSINSVAYGNGYWVAAGQYYKGSGTGYAQIAYTTDVTSDSWSIKEIWYSSSSGGRNVINSITYANGYWVIGGQSSVDNARIAYATDPTSTWTMKDLWSSENNYSIMHNVVYANGYWIASGECYDDGYKARLAYTTDLTGTWTMKDLWGASQYNSTINSLACANNYLVAGGYYYDANGGNYARIAYDNSTIPFGKL